jgi:small subunit ribosomal protein S9
MATKSIYATGRRKTSTARVYVQPATGGSDGRIIINNRTVEAYFPRPVTQMIIKQPLEYTEKLGSYDFKVTVSGGGISGQAGAVLHGISRALLKADPALRKTLKSNGFLTRDARKVERKKPGRHKARKKPQFSKR